MTAAALAVLAQIVAVAKGISALKAIGDQLFMMWVLHDLEQIGNEAEAKKEEYEAINSAYKASNSNTERRALLRALNRVR